jgi:hypothetical protein
MIDNDGLAEDDIEEALDDLSTNRDWGTGAVLWSTDWTAETILSQLSRLKIDLDPNFQRRSAWTDNKQSLFIESLILNLPIPQLILAEAIGKKGSFIVIDGKQRPLTIRRFGSTNSNAQPKPLKLSGLKELKNLNGKTYSHLVDDPRLSDYRSAFENSSVRTVVIRNWRDEEYLYDVFLRINTGSVQLSSQELRQALHPGEFSNFINEASSNSRELQRALNLKQPDFRMRDAEILLRFLAYKNFIGNYNGNLKQFLDSATQRLNSAWDDNRQKLYEQKEQMESALKFTREAFGETSYLRKWNGRNFESKKNRAIFDIMLHYFSESLVRKALNNRTKYKELIEEFKNLCTENDEFRAAIETTTKSLVSNQARFNLWGGVVEKISGVSIEHLKFPVRDELN